jgi:hypothetical protein
MHKKLEADLMSLAHSILTMKNKEDVFALKEKSKEVYEKLSMLAFVEEYVKTTPGLEKTKEALVEEVTIAFNAKKSTIIEEKNPENEIATEEKVVYNLEDEPEEAKKEQVISTKQITPNTIQDQIIPIKVEEIIEQPFDELEELMFSEDKASEAIKPESVLENEVTTLKEGSLKGLQEEIKVIEPLENDVVKTEERKIMSLEEELQDIVSVDVMADLFENTKPKSLNDKLVSNIQIGLNDRIAFVKNLFEGDQENYNRVISQLNTFKSERDAKTFINTMVKPDYDWSEQEELETRFMEIIARKFA